MKTIKIRFIKVIPVDKSSFFYIQKKRLWWWVTLGYWMGSVGGDVWYPYTNIDKDKLLNTVLENYYKTDRKFIKITEYPSLKLY